MCHPATQLSERVKKLQNAKQFANATRGRYEVAESSLPRLFGLTKVRIQMRSRQSDAFAFGAKEQICDPTADKQGQMRIDRLGH